MYKKISTFRTQESYTAPLCAVVTGVTAEFVCTSFDNETVGEDPEYPIF